jgi:hypothetical protein
VKAAKDAIIALGLEEDWQGLEAVRAQLDHTRRTIPLGEVSVGELATLLRKAYRGVNKQIGLMDDYRDALREAVAEVDAIMKGIHLHVLTYAAAKLRAQVAADE